MRLNTPRLRPVRRRTGFTLVELLVVLVLLSIIGGGMMRVLGNQQRFYNGTSDITELRTQLRQGISVVGNDLRNMSSAGGDLIALTDSSLDFRYTIGSSIVCAKSGSTITLPPMTLSSGAVLTSWISRPAANDTAYIFNEGSDSTTSSDDAWTVYQVNSNVDAIGACASTYTSGTDGTRASYTVTLGSSVASNIRVGAPVRFVRRSHYSLYRATDGLWYLGYCSLACGVGNVIQPLAGPFNAYAAAGGGTSGMRITYYDSTGATTATAANVARINIVLRGTTKGYVNISGITRGYYVDSVRTDVAIRNRS